MSLRVFLFLRGCFVLGNKVCYWRKGFESGTIFFIQFLEVVECAPRDLEAYRRKNTEFCDCDWSLEHRKFLWGFFLQ